MTDERPLSIRMADVERRLESDRERALGEWRQTGIDVQRATARLPLVALGAALAIGIFVGQRPGQPARPSATSTNALSRLLQFGALALRVALSPEVQRLLRRNSPTAYSVPR